MEDKRAIDFVESLRVALSFLLWYKSGISHKVYVRADHLDFYFQVFRDIPYCDHYLERRSGCMDLVMFSVSGDVLHQWAERIGNEADMLVLMLNVYQKDYRESDEGRHRYWMRGPIPESTDD